MPELDYGYEVTIAQNATSDPAATTVTNQWQRQISGNANWEDIGSGETYKIAAGDRSAKIRLQQDLDGAKVYSNQLQVTSDEPGCDLEEWATNIYAEHIYGAVLGKDGKIYTIPSGNVPIVAIDVETREFTSFGSISGSPTVGRWSGGVLHTNGKIYGVPFNFPYVLEINTSNKTTTYWGHAGSGTAKYSGGVLAPNGKIYAMPGNSNTVAEIDIKARDIYSFGYNIDGQFVGGVLAPNGKIYGVPHQGGAVLEVDPSARRTSTFAITNYSGSGGWNYGALAPDGNIYCLPAYDQTSILQIDPVTKTATTWGIVEGLLGNGGHFTGAVLAPNGKIYGVPSRYEGFLEIDPVNKTLKRVCGEDIGYYAGAVLALNGKVYALGASNGQMAGLNVGAGPATGDPGSESWPLPGLPGNILDPRSAYFNKY